MIQEKKIFFNGEYAADHWANQPFSLNDTKVVSLFKYVGSEYALYLNPTDKRGYRAIVRLIDSKKMDTTFNREYLSSEHLGLSIVVSLVEEAFRRMVPIVQTFKAGNNSHQFNKESGVTFIGKAEEPSFLHTHVIGRGNPETEYVPGVKLDGPVPGLNFDMMAKTENQPGNDKKIAWKESEMAKVADVLKTNIDELKIDYEGILVVQGMEKDLALQIMTRSSEKN